MLSKGTAQTVEPSPADRVENTETVPEESAVPQVTATAEPADNIPEETVERVTESAATEKKTGIGSSITSALGNVFSGVSDALAPTYIADIGSAVFHELDCAKVDEISAVNRWECTKTRDELLRLGYEPCPVCNP
jgi:hypothetical protein